MDAYSSYIMILAEARANELRREAAEYALSRAARRERTSLWRRTRQRLLGGARPAPAPVAPLPLPVDAGDPELRRSA
jgi:hypothetical protein